MDHVIYMVFFYSTKPIIDNTRFMVSHYENGTLNGDLIITCCLVNDYIIILGVVFNGYTQNIFN